MKNNNNDENLPFMVHRQEDGTLTNSDKLSDMDLTIAEKTTECIEFLKKNDVPFIFVYLSQNRKKVVGAAHLDEATNNMFAGLDSYMRGMFGLKLDKIEENE